VTNVNSIAQLNSTNNDEHFRVCDPYCDEQCRRWTMLSGEQCFQDFKEAAMKAETHNKSQLRRKKKK